jgi:hypothetical protein
MGPWESSWRSNWCSGCDLEFGGSVVPLMFHELEPAPVFGIDALRTPHMSRMGLPAASFFSGWCEINVIDTLVCLNGFHVEMLNSANGVSREAASLNSVHDVVELRRAHSRLLDKVPDAQYQWEVLPNGIGLITVIAAGRRMGFEAVSLTYFIDQAVRDLREEVPPTLNSWKLIYREACEKYLSSGHVVEHDVVNNEVSWIPS